MTSVSPGNDVDGKNRGTGRAWALARYVFAATLVRSGDGGAVVAIVLLAQASGLSAWASGMLGAAITAPHLLGPFIARRLDTARDGRVVIALSAVAHGLLRGAAAMLLSTGWVIWPALLLCLSGLFGPMLTGGVSSRLPSIAGPSRRSQRRAQSWDVASYGISGTLGPAVVAWVAVIIGPLAATLALAAAAVIGAGAPGGLMRGVAVRREVAVGGSCAEQARHHVRAEQRGRHRPREPGAVRGERDLTADVGPAVRSRQLPPVRSSPGYRYCAAIGQSMGSA